ncbi:MAG: hypothetical protein RR303_03895 [Bacteroidales bacterium]
MKSKLLWIGFLLYILVIHAQEISKIPPDMKRRTISFSSPELEVDSFFLRRLDSILFNQKCGNLLLLNVNDSDNHFNLDFKKIDSANYLITVFYESIQLKI